jgi:hypothetical protein
MDIDVTLRLPKDIVDQAISEGVLNDTRMTELLRDELERRARWRELFEAVAPVQAAMRAEFPNLSDDEAMEMIARWADEEDLEA